MASFGTATTLDTIGPDNVFPGGLILPGPAMMRARAVATSGGCGPSPWPWGCATAIAIPTNWAPTAGRAWWACWRASRPCTRRCWWPVSARPPRWTPSGPTMSFPAG
ncbi:hypothetical protein CKW48_13560 [Bordetella pertussis]|nr:hypothetical protein CKW48_13560 [Bordetella pertussis]